MRTTARVTGAAVAVAAALLMTGCGSEGGGAKTDDAGGGSSQPASLAGGWTAGEIADGDHKILVFVKDSDYVTLSSKAASCSGSYDEGADPVTLDMRCTNGSGFEKGTVESIEGRTMTVSWGSGRTDTFTKPKVPEGVMPSAGDLPDIPDLPQ